MPAERHPALLVARAITWELWRRNRVGIVLSFAVLLACSVLYPMFLEGDPSPMARIFSVYPLGIALLHAVFVFTYADDDPRKATSRVVLLSARSAAVLAAALAAMALVVDERVGHHLVAAGFIAVSLGLAPLAAAPLALSWGRHR